MKGKCRNMIANKFKNLLRGKLAVMTRLRAPLLHVGIPLAFPFVGDGCAEHLVRVLACFLAISSTRNLGKWNCTLLNNLNITTV